MSDEVMENEVKENGSFPPVKKYTAEEESLLSQLSMENSRLEEHQAQNKATEIQSCQ